MCNGWSRAYVNTCPLTALVRKQWIPALKPVESFFVNLKALSISGPLLLVKDLTDVTHSSHLEKLAIGYTEDTTQQTDNAHTNLSSIPSNVAGTVISRWSHTISRITMDVEKLSVARGTAIILPGATFKQMLLGFSLHHLELKGWTIEGLDTALRSFPPPSPFIPSLSKLEDLSLPSHVGARGLGITDLDVFAKTFPNLKNLQCRLKPLTVVPTPGSVWFSGAWPSKAVRNRKFRSLTIGDDPDEATHPSPLQIFNIARYIDHLFPELLVLKAREGAEKNVEHWEMVGKLVKMLQELRSDERKDCLEHTP